MSLLMDALKKAEAAKQQAADNLASTPLDLSVDGSTNPPLQLAPHTEPVLPDLAQHSAAVDADLATEGATEPRRATSGTRVNSTSTHEASDRQAARNVFAAKQAPASRALLWLFAGVAGIAALSITGYFWWQLQSVSVAPLRPLSPPVAPAPPTAAASPSAATQPLAAESRIAQPEPPAAASPAPVAANPATTGAPASTTATPAVLFARTDKQRSSTPAKEQTPKASAKSLPPPRDSGLQFSKTAGITPLERAYEALQADQLDEAQGQYARVLRNDRNNTDALLGLATIAVRQGKLEDALTWYQRVLEADPNEPTAQAALINLRGQNDPGIAESRLKTALASQPESAALHFALGNLYARQQRWSDAQQAYFTAFTREGNNADYIFNLAVSLDHLHQHKLAAQYYQMAVNTAQSVRSVSFDTTQARNRALELQR